MLYTAHTKDNFDSLFAELPSLAEVLGEGANDVLFIYLMKLRTGRSNIEIATHCQCSKTTIQRRISVVRDILKRVIVPKYLEFERSREDLVSYKSKLSSALFDGEDQSRAHLILDGTYLYVDKSTNYRAQKQTYNSHKKRNYLKIMMGVATDGKIILASGPFKATDNDAEITKTIFNRSPSPAIKNYQPGDIMIVDRGFRDCADDLRSHGFIGKMPTCSANPQLTSYEANSTRFVTIIRYNVERMNGVMKGKWKLFATQIDTRLIRPPLYAV